MADEPVFDFSEQCSLTLRLDLDCFLQPESGGWRIHRGSDELATGAVGAGPFDDAHDLLDALLEHVKLVPRQGALF